MSRDELRLDESGPLWRTLTPRLTPLSEGSQRMGTSIRFPLALIGGISGAEMGGLPGCCRKVVPLVVCEQRQNPEVRLEVLKHGVFALT